MNAWVWFSEQDSFSWRKNENKEDEKRAQTDGMVVKQKKGNLWEHWGKEEEKNDKMTVATRKRRIECCQAQTITEHQTHNAYICNMYSVSIWKMGISLYNINASHSRIYEKELRIVPLSTTIIQWMAMISLHCIVVQEQLIERCKGLLMCSTGGKLWRE